jgi:hypothetical protein
MNDAAHNIVAIVVAIVGVAVIAVIVSKNANTTGVIQASASGLGNDLLAAEAPVLSQAPTGNLSYPS